MSHSYALSVSRANLCSEIWQNRLAETGIKNVECCTGPFSDFSEAKDTVEKINPAIQAGCFQIVSLHLPFWWGQVNYRVSRMNFHGRSVLNA